MQLIHMLIRCLHWVIFIPTSDRTVCSFILDICTVSFFFPSCLYDPKEQNWHFPAHTQWDLGSTILWPPGRSKMTCVTSSPRSFMHVKWFTSSSTGSMRSQVISLFALKNWSLLTNCLDGCLSHGLIFCVSVTCITETGITCQFIPDIIITFGFWFFDITNVTFVRTSILYKLS